MVLTEIVKLAVRWIFRHLKHAAILLYGKKEGKDSEKNVRWKKSWQQQRNTQQKKRLHRLNCLIQSVPRVEVIILRDDESPSLGFVRRPHPLYPEFAVQMTWFSRIECQANGREGMVYVWVSKQENLDYERPHRRKRFCKTYRGHIRDVFVSA